MDTGVKSDGRCLLSAVRFIKLRVHHRVLRHMGETTSTPAFSNEHRSRQPAMAGGLFKRRGGLPLGLWLSFALSECVSIDSSLGQEFLQCHEL